MHFESYKCLKSEKCILENLDLQICILNFVKYKFVNLNFQIIFLKCNSKFVNLNFRFANFVNKCDCEISKSKF